MKRLPHARSVRPWLLGSARRGGRLCRQLLQRASIRGRFTGNSSVAGTAAGESGEVVTNGGRVLGITGRGNGLKDALDKAYQAISDIQFEGAYYRSDIGFRVMEND